MNFTIEVVGVSDFSVVDRLHRAANFTDFHLLLRQQRILSQYYQIFFGPLQTVNLIRESFAFLDLALLS